MDAKEVMVLITGAHKAYALHMVNKFWLIQEQNKQKLVNPDPTCIYVIGFKLGSYPIPWRFRIKLDYWIAARSWITTYWH